MKLVILTSMRNSTASRCLPVLCNNEKIQVDRVIFVRGLTENRKKVIRQKIRKVFRIGILGAINGVRMRRWYAEGELEDISEVCASNHVPFYETDYMGSDKTKSLFEDADADLGVSLGNGYIPANIFNIPKFGMINAHGELLPQYQNAQSIIWPIYMEKKHTGVTIHQIDKGVDTGEIIFQKKYKIEFYPTLEETVKKNLAITANKAPEVVSYACANYLELKKHSVKQINGNSFTTPSLRQFFQMQRNNNRMFQQQRKMSCNDKI